MTTPVPVDTTPNGSKSTDSAPLTHTQGLNLFDRVLNTLARAGWTRLRIDTLVHHSSENGDPRTRWTVRHQYDHGIWYLHYEPDAYWRRGQGPDPAARVARIRLDRPDITADSVLFELFGRDYGRFTQPVHYA